jgi:CRISPR-associated protein Csx10
LKESEAIAAIESTQVHPPALPEPSQLDQDGTLALGDRSNSDWWRVVLEVTTRSPVIIHQRTIGNHQETHDCIPGTYFVPIMLKSLRDYCSTSVENALMHGDVVITHANRVVNSRRGEAVPFSLFEPKAKTATATIQQQLGKEINDDSVNGQQLKGIRRGYVGLQEKTLHRMTVSPEIAAHNTIVDTKQRPDTEVGGIYTYAAIPAGLTFHLEIRIRDYLVLKDGVHPLANFLAADTLMQIGRTKKDDYGSVKLKQIRREKIVSNAQTQTDILRVWLLSDLLLRDERLRLTVDPQVFAKQLEKYLGEDITLTLLEKSQTELPQIQKMVAFARSRRTESWQTRWGLPRPSLVGLSAGTALQFNVTGTLDLEKLKALEIAGFGERTAEGYGQLRFNPTLLMQKDLNLAHDKDNESESVSKEPILIAKDTPEYKYAQLIERETWRELIRCAAGAIAADPEQSKLLKPLTLNTSNLTASKLGGLRSLIDSLNRPEDKERDKERILKVINRMEAKEAWKGKTLDCVKQLVANEETVWQCYPIDFSRYRLTQDSEASIKQDLWVEAVRILVDACVRAQKRASELSNQEEQANG